MRCSCMSKQKRSGVAVAGCMLLLAAAGASSEDSPDQRLTDALLQEGVISPTTPITVPNRLYRAGKSFKDFEEHGVEHLTYAGTLAKSSNIGTIKAAERLGNLKRLYPYFAKFGGRITSSGQSRTARDIGIADRTPNFRAS